MRDEKEIKRELEYYERFLKEYKEDLLGTGVKKLNLTIKMLKWVLGDE